MNNKFRNILSSVTLIVAILISSCDDKESLSPLKVNFTNSEIGISEANNTAEVGITFSRPAEADGSLSLTISGDLSYGNDFATLPAAINNVIGLTYSAGMESIEFTVSAGTELNIDEDKTLTITINDPDNLLNLGENNSIEVVFSENFIAPAGTANLDAGGEGFTHQSFFDLSKLTQTKVEKLSWDLGFHTGPDYLVALNSSSKIMAQMISKNDLTTVTAQDTLGFGSSQNFNAYNGDAVDWVDAPDLDSLAIGTISATEEENNVFIISREGDLNWQKIRIIRNGDGYSIQYADIASTSFQTTEIVKDDKFNYSFFSFENGITSVQPEKEAWDIMYSSFTNVVNYGYFLPYSFSDFITINPHNTSVLQVMTSDGVSYSEFELSDASALVLSTNQNTIGSSWRQGGGPGTAPSLFEDRFYILKDAQGNLYKFMFTSMTSSEGKRGYAEFIFELL